ncbi:hypothetical protein PCANC_10585 [Puccinia coronata f. sp. avenae]|uniref:Uncharacterized protein n=1 Tax=Puccinia coronata f. sp. avenae TaxID=200324 RepID=A0A2N5VR49_9BASI|nr:hypothetical protein PCANC_20563 [Puccinia coronata f. sp. avenae]PLW32969.1 hypothetical protein PCASD_20099 [Puccinia coronata f. sp. avenae]PLW52468.1 hypothetical protein PCANC_10585 [Puccinia coronata f. sp. avenae]
MIQVTQKTCNQRQQPRKKFKTFYHHDNNKILKDLNNNQLVHSVIALKSNHQSDMASTTITSQTPLSLPYNAPIKNSGEKPSQKKFNPLKTTKCGKTTTMIRQTLSTQPGSSG